MSIMDAELLFCEDQIPGATGNATSDVDLGAGKDHLAAATVLDAGESAKQQWLNVVVGVDFDTATSYVFNLTHSTTDGGTFAILMATPAILLATLAAGYVIFRAPIPPDSRRYLRLSWVLTGGANTAGTITAWIGPSGQR